MGNDNFRNDNLSVRAHGHLICWRSSLAGVFIALLTFAGVMTLSIAFGGIGLDDGSTVKNATIFAGVSLVVAMIIGNFTGSYYSVRISRMNVDVLGVMQGLLVGSLVTLFILCQAMSSVATVGKITGAALGATASAAGGAAMSQSSLIEDVIEDAVGNKKFVTDQQTVVRKVASRLIRGDQEGAKNYLAYQAGITPAEADNLIATAKTKVDQTLEETRKAAATTLKAVGWSTFVAIVLATIASVLGGLLGALCNSRGTMDIPVTRKN